MDNPTLIEMYEDRIRDTTYLMRKDGIEYDRIIFILGEITKDLAVKAFAELAKMP